MHTIISHYICSEVYTWLTGKIYFLQSFEKLMVLYKFGKETGAPKADIHASQKHLCKIFIVSLSLLVLFIFLLRCVWPLWNSVTRLSLNKKAVVLSTQMKSWLLQMIFGSVWQWSLMLEEQLLHSCSARWRWSLCDICLYTQHSREKEWGYNAQFQQAAFFRAPASTTELHNYYFPCSLSH